MREREKEREKRGRERKRRERKRREGERREGERKKERREKRKRERRRKIVMTRRGKSGNKEEDIRDACINKTDRTTLDFGITFTRLLKHQVVF